jgi:hypothetical protein
VILFDKRGTCTSDPVRADGLPTLEQRIEDVRAMMDAVAPSAPLRRSDYASRARRSARASSAQHG